MTPSTVRATMARVIAAEPRALATLRKVPAHVDRAVRRALEKVPADRFATAREFADAFVALSMAALSESPRSRFESWREKWLQ